MAKEVVKKIKLQIPAGKATPAPPVGTVLGPAGINLQEFCTKYNDATREKMGDILPVEISIYDDNQDAAYGGYEFDEYRWFRDGVLIPDENNAFYYLNGGVFGSECYYLEVRRKDDGVVMRTCEICPGETTAIDDVFLSDKELLQYSLFQPGQRINIDNISVGYVKIYTFTGQLLYSYNM